MGFAGLGWGAQRRRDRIVPRLLDAGIDVLLELGPQRCTAEAVARRAEVAPAALFHHFGALEDFFIAVAEEIACRQLVDFQAMLDATPREEESLETGLRLLAELSARPVNAVFLDLISAARTDPVFAVRLEPLLMAYRRDIQAIAGQLPGLDAVPPELLSDLLLLALDLFRGTWLSGGDHRDRIPLILSMLRGELAFLTEGRSAGPAAR